jgi:hypothetical protein
VFNIVNGFEHHERRYPKIYTPENSSPAMEVVEQTQEGNIEYIESMMLELLLLKHSVIDVQRIRNPI